jgi:hypothetical protein
MKAKDYAEKYKIDPSVKTLLEIWLSMYKEIGSITRERNASSNDAINTIYDEQCRKWKAFARLTDDVKEDGFEGAMKEYAPEFYEAVQEYKFAVKLRKEMRVQHYLNLYERLL